MFRDLKELGRITEEEYEAIIERFNGRVEGTSDDIRAVMSGCDRNGRG